MKNFKHIALSIFASGTLFLGSCDHNEFLTEVNPNAITESTFWKTEADAFSALTTVYGALQFQYVSGGGLTYEIAKSDLGGTNSWTRHFAYVALTVADNQTPVFNKWSENYVGIFRANQVIDNVPTMDALSEETKTEILAEARFLRAFFYFDLAHSFGQAIIRTTSDDETHKGLSSIAEINEQVIIPDLEYAMAHLPQTRPDAELGRVTWGAATTLLGKTYLYDKEWASAAENFKKVIDSGLYSLTSNFGDNFRHDMPYNSEAIMEVPYDGSINPGSGNPHYIDDDPNAAGGESTSLARWYGPYSLGGWQVVMPTYWIHELMTADEVAGGGQSSRYLATLAGRDLEGLYYGESGSELKSDVPRRWNFGESSYVKKYTNWYHLGEENNEWRSSINYKHMRLADVYLMYAEAVLEGEQNVETAIDYIDMVRERAGVITLQEYMDTNGTIPQLHVSQDLYGTRPEVVANVDNIRTHLRMVERPTELAFENVRWRDLVRWGVVGEVLTSHHNDEVARTAIGADPSRAPLFIEQRIRPDFVSNHSNYSAEDDDYFPIPAAEVQANDAL
ncbi:RagB/SusD family nutrient uptake outer membrane protein [Sediminitomix flava]|uniref:Putative outer membrane starch-binding protein n=1 Tax=Sediminitomix flava TaxID=379075 RepID=A0A315Z936_SEDFL|nr:RagB/SusD family nutrient uptake outer membrane protein [Sediminitomix flava]PWJ41802.1 putative outer membrane starch-binding protein [Sediminitomix flava]